MFQRIKEDLRSNKDDAQVAAVIKINNILGDYNDASFNEFIKKIITSGVGDILCDHLITQNDVFFMQLQKCLLRIAESKIFYSSSLLKYVIKKVFDIGDLITENTTQKQSHLKSMAPLLATILQRSRRYNYSYNEFNQLLFIVECVGVNNTPNPFEITSGSKLLFVVMQHMNNKPLAEKHLIVLQKLYKDCLTGLSKILLENVYEDVLHIFVSITLALGISTEGLRLTENFEISNSSFSQASTIDEADQIERATIFKNIIQFTFEQIFDIIIPNFRKIDESDRDPAVPLQHLAECLTLLFKSENIDHQKLANELLSQKYLDYFMTKIEFRRGNAGTKCSICKCVSYIVMHDANNCFAIDEWGLSHFRIFINEGLLFFSINPDIDHDMPYLDAFLFCIYSCYRFNPHSSIINSFRKILLAKKIETFPVENPPKIPIIQVAWILFSILLIETDIAESDVAVVDALNKIIVLINVLGIENCYTHHPAVLISVLRISVFPKEFAYQLIKLSLESDPPITNIFELVGAEYKQIIVASLMHALLSGKKIVAERACDEFHKIIFKHSSLGHIIISSMWADLPQILSTYNETNVEQYLKLLSISDHDKLSRDVALECSSTFLTTFTRQDINISDQIKSYIMLLIPKTLYLAPEKKEIISLFINNAAFLNIVYSDIIKEGNDDLSAIALISLSAMLSAQIELSIEAHKILSINLDELLDLLSRKSFHPDIVLKFCNMAWISGINDENSIICVSINVENAKATLLAIYDQLWCFFGKSAQSEWPFMFTNLTNFLHFCYKNYSEVIQSCCDHPETSLMITLSINRDCILKEFFEFMKILLKYGLTCGSHYIKRAMNSKNIQEHGIKYAFDIMLKRFEIYVKSLIDSGRVEKESLEEVMQIISTTI